MVAESKLERFSKPKLTTGQILSDKLTRTVGSWKFIFGLIIFIISWITFNTYQILTGAWDPYPHIVLNLCLSCLAAIQAPIILMSQNRENQRDRARAKLDYYINRKAEKENREIMEQLQSIRASINKIKKK